MDNELTEQQVGKEPIWLRRLRTSLNAADMCGMKTVPVYPDDLREALRSKQQAERTPPTDVGLNPEQIRDAVYQCWDGYESRNKALYEINYERLAARLNRNYAELAAGAAAPETKETPVLEPSCMDCGQHYSLSLILSREQWLLINPQDWGMLCARCMGERAAKLDHVLWINGKIIFPSDIPDAEPAAAPPSLLAKLRELRDHWNRDGARIMRNHEYANEFDVGCEACAAELDALIKEAENE